MTKATEKATKNNNNNKNKLTHQAQKLILHFHQINTSLSPISKRTAAAITRLARNAVALASQTYLAALQLPAKPARSPYIVPDEQPESRAVWNGRLAALETRVLITTNSTTCQTVNPSKAKRCDAVKRTTPSRRVLPLAPSVVTAGGAWTNIAANHTVAPLATRCRNRWGLGWETSFKKSASLCVRCPGLSARGLWPRNEGVIYDASGCIAPRGAPSWEWGGRGMWFLLMFLITKRLPFPLLLRYCRVAVAVF